MKTNIEITNDQIKEYLNELYKCFESGYDFEFFLKPYLEKIGLDEVKVTQKSKDGGIDLVAVRPGIGGFSEADTIDYYIQAKRFNPLGPKVSVKAIRELKGVIPFANKGIFITTAFFSDDAINESNNDPSKPVVLIDGKALIESCIDNEIGFIFNPIFNKKMLNSLIQKKENKSIEKEDREFLVEKAITNNDIRTKIIRIPSDAIKLMNLVDNKIKVKLGSLSISEYKYNKIGQFISGVSAFFRSEKIIDENGMFYPCKAKWYYKDDIFYVEVVNE